MNKKSKLNLGQRTYQGIFFSEEEKRFIINDYLSGDESKQVVYRRYTGYEVEHGKLLKWMRKLGIEDKYPKKSTFVNMPKNTNLNSSSFERLKLEKRIEDLEKQLKEAEMKTITYSTMVDIAEKEFNIAIRKKHNTKP